MDSQALPTSWSFWGRWVVATCIGWVLGIIMAFALSYQVVNLFYPEETNLIVGPVLGASVAFAQMIAARRLVSLTYRWVWGAAVGLGIPFIVAVLIDEIWLGTSETSEMWLLLVVAAGGALTGVLQARALRPHTPRAQWWILASLMSWGLAWLTSIVVGEAGFRAGGIILGALSGALLIWLLRFLSADDAA